MLDQSARATAFHALHRAGSPLVLFNVWDAGSARAVAAAGARALATGSWSVAAAHGYADGEALPLDLVIANVARIVAVTELPVSVDLESGYGERPDAVGATVAQAIAAGAVGCNLEDSLPATGALRPIPEAAERIAAARAAAARTGVPFFVNARCDAFYQSPAPATAEALVTEALARAREYAAAGASGLFLPGLVREDAIGAIAAATSLPLNVMVDAGTPPLHRLRELGVARVSHGAGPYRAAMQALEAAARAAF